MTTLMNIFSFPPIVNESSSILILGTMPGKKSLELQQYYGHGGNQFWKIMYKLLERPFSTDYKKRIELLQDHNIALWDVLQACERESSADSDIIEEVPNDFEIFFNIHPNIKAVFFNGKNAKEYFDQYVLNVPKNSTVLPSTSPANTWKTFDEKVEEWKQILA